MATRRRKSSTTRTRKIKTPAAKRDTGNFVSEYYGHRVYPLVSATANALDDQTAARCPFISRAIGEPHKCVKTGRSAGICTISAVSNGVRQDWLACPFRALGNPLLEDVTKRLFGIAGTPHIVAGPSLVKEEVRDQVAAALASGDRVVVFLSNKMGGEIRVQRTQHTPRVSFDTTLVELATDEAGEVGVRRYGILELQTADFHGSYGAAVQNLQNALRLHRDKFHEELLQNQRWLSEDVEGPNIANVFKRTFYQVVLKFRIGAHASCVGCVLAIPASVWDSWQRHLGAPALSRELDGTYSLFRMSLARAAKVPAWIYVFDIDVSATVSPNTIAIRQVIATDADTVAYQALQAVPDMVVAAGGAVDNVLLTIHDRIAEWWPGLGVS